MPSSEMGKPGRGPGFGQGGRDRIMSSLCVKFEMLGRYYPVAT